MAAEEKYSIAERRRYVRVDCLMAGEVVSVGPATENISIGLTKNLSATGLLFTDTKKYEIGDVVVVSIDKGAVEDLDENLAIVIKTREFVMGRIVRKEEFEGECCEYGVCFVRNDKEGIDYFGVFVDLINQVKFQEK